MSKQMKLLLVLLLAFLFLLSVFLLLPRQIVQNVDACQIYRVSYAHADVTDKLDLQELALVLSGYRCSRYSLSLLFAKRCCVRN